MCYSTGEIKVEWTQRTNTAHISSDYACYWSHCLYCLIPSTMTNIEMEWKPTGEKKIQGVEIITPHLSSVAFRTISRPCSRYMAFKKISDVQWWLGIFRRTWLSPWTAAPHSCGPPAEEAESVCRGSGCLSTQVRLIWSYCPSPSPPPLSMLPPAWWVKLPGDVLTLSAKTAIRTLAFCTVGLRTGWKDYVLSLWKTLWSL